MMSDRPLFEHMDEQEAEYAPEELPAGSPQARQARIDEGTTGSIADEGIPAEGAVVPGAAEAAVEGGAVSGQMGGAVAGAIPAIVGPAATEEALEGNTNVQNIEGEEDRSA